MLKFEITTDDDDDDDVNLKQNEKQKNRQPQRQQHIILNSVHATQKNLYLLTYILFFTFNLATKGLFLS